MWIHYHNTCAQGLIRFEGLLELSLCDKLDYLINSHDDIIAVFRQNHPLLQIQFLLAGITQELGPSHLPLEIIIII